MNFKQRIQALFFPLGSTQVIRRGYLKGYKIKISENSLWSPLIGRWEPAMQQIMANVVKPGDVVYDLGANNGLHGMLMAGLIKPAKVFNFEPFEGNISEIVENYALNGITNYQNIQAAVSDTNGTVTFSLGHHHKQGAIVQDGKMDSNKIEVASITLDKFIDDGNPGPAFIKVDIEGAEGAALRGFSKNISKFQPFLLIELHNPEQDRQVGQFLKEFGYSAHRIDPFKKLSFTTITDFSSTYPSPSGIWGTIFCLPPGKKLEELSFTK